MGAKPSLVPIEQNHNLHKNSNALLSPIDIACYRRIIVHLIYLTVTRPDISYVVQVPSQFITKPRLIIYRTLIVLLDI